MTPALSGQAVSVNPSPVNLRCPACRRLGTFGGHGIQDLIWVNKREAVGVGVRFCPNAECRRAVFVVLRGQTVEATFPPEVLEFDATNLPPAIAASLSEAVQCHAAGAFRAAALMVRRVLEELCADRGAEGTNLVARRGALQKTVVVPKELLDAANELRLLGNDAAHIEAKLYDSIGKDEAAVAIELAKELLKAVYQYEGLVAKLRAFRKPVEA